MAYIKTTLREVKVKETISEVYSTFSQNDNEYHSLIQLTEIFSGEKMSGQVCSHERTIHLNKNFILEMHD